VDLLGQLLPQLTRKLLHELAVVDFSQLLLMLILKSSDDSRIQFVVNGVVLLDALQDLKFLLQLSFLRVFTGKHL
jgi:hypothetical protein